MASIAKRPDGRWRARYRDDAGKEHARHFDRKLNAQRWLDQQTAALVAGTHVAPRDARVTVGEWCDTWLAGYGANRASTVRQAGVHVAKIKAEFGSLPLSAVRPSQVRTWTARLKADGASHSYVYALHSRLSQVMADAVHDGLLARNPCSRRTSPGAAGRQLGPWQLDRAIRSARTSVVGLPDGFRFHDLRHYLASLLIASGADVKVVQSRLRHASAKTTLDTHSHLWPDADESTRAAVGAVLTARADSLRTDTGSAG
jgi:hypothetical protein